jgi:hypothetical protein
MNNIKLYTITLLFAATTLGSVVLSINEDRTNLAAPAPKEFHAFGTVRGVEGVLDGNMNIANEVLFEHDNGIIQLLAFENRVPVREGDHVELVYKPGRRRAYTFLFAKRITHGL